MTTYRLAPVPEHRDHRDWAASTRQNCFFVGAEDEQQAREIAMSAFSIATKVDGGPMRFCPWRQEHLTTCEKVADITIGELPLGKVRIPEYPGLLDPSDL